ncbi:helix-turn-helix domain-containing protein, partial [Actinomadura logoneensis]
VERARAAGPGDPVVAPVVRGLLAGASVPDVADAVGLGERQLRRRALAAFGYGPKVLQRVLRFQRALGAVRAGVPAAEAAVDAGYADQAHMAHEMRKLAGVPLGGLVGPND